MRSPIFLMLVLAISTSCSLCTTLPEADDPDAGTDATLDVRDVECAECVDARLDAETDARPDARPDAESDAQTDAALDAAPDMTVCGDCSALDGVCFVGTCDPSTQECQARALPDGSACDDGDGLACTASACDGGACESALREGFCLIDGACYAAGVAQPGSPCFVCDPAASTSAFTQAPELTACDDGDGLDCTVGTCDLAAVCQSALAADTCLINQTCYNAGASDPAAPCDVCDPVTSTSAFTPAGDGTACSSTECTTGVCSSNVCINEAVDAGSCQIADVCYANNEVNPANECEICNSTLRATDWSSRGAVACGSLSNCRCSLGSCRRPNDELCQ